MKLNTWNENSKIYELLLKHHGTKANEKSGGHL
jgi:hypothetical protein